MDYAGFVQVLQGLLVPDNAVRRQAEAAYQAGTKQNPVGAAQLLVQAVRTGETAALRTIAAILLRRALLPESGLYTKALDAHAKNAVKNHLLEALTHEPEASIRRKICHCCAVVVACIPKDWPQLPAFALARSAASVEAGLRVDGLFLLEKIAEYAPTLAVSNFDDFGQTLSTALTDAAYQVQISALLATVDLILALDAGKKKRAATLIPGMITAISTALHANDEDAAQQALEGMSEIARGSPTVLTNVMDQLGTIILQVASAQQFDDGTRAAALEVLVELGEFAPAVLRTQPALVEALLRTAVLIIAEDEGGETWSAGSYDTIEEDYQDTSAIGISVVGRIADSLGAKTIARPALSIIPPLFQDADWHKRFAGLMALSEVVKVCEKPLRDDMSNVLNLVIQRLSDPEQRVRFAAIHCMSRFSDELKPKFQTKHHAAYLPAIIAVLRDPTSCDRVRGHAASSVTTFCDESCPVGALTPHLSALLESLFAVLQHSRVDVQEEALVAVSRVAGVADSDFSPFYDSFMPPLKSILQTASSREHRALRARAMECIGLIADSVGPEQFGKDAEEVMHLLVTAQRTMDADSPWAESVLHACSRICKCIKGRFAPFLPSVLPPLFQVLKRSVDFAAEDVEDDDAGKGYSQEGEMLSTIVAVRGAGYKRISLNTSLIEEKRVALNILSDLALNMGAPFAGAAAEAGKYFLEHVSFRFYEAVRSAAALGLANILTSLVAHGKTIGSMEQASSFFDASITSLMKAMKKEVQPEARACMAEGVSDLLRAALYSGDENEKGQPINPVVGIELYKVPAFIKSVVDQCVESMQRRQQAIERVQERIGRISEDDAHDELGDALELEDEFMQQISDAHGFVLKLHGAKFLPIFERISLPFFTPLLADPDNVVVFLCAICAFDDVIEHCGVGAAGSVPICARALAIACTHEDERVRQAGVYGLGLIAENQPAQFKPMAGEVLKNLIALITRPDARQEENEDVTENAISAVLKVMLCHPDVSNPPALMPQWLSWLPLTSDMVEAQLVHHQLVELAAKREGAVLGAGLGNVPTLVRIFAALLGSGSSGGEVVLNVATDATKAQIKQILAQWGTDAALRAAVQQGLSALDERQRSLIVGSA